jgi:hypothetical protein
MLTADMKERSSSCIELKYMKLTTGKDLLFYLYNRQLREDADAMGLLAFRTNTTCRQCCLSGIKFTFKNVFNAEKL